MFYKFAKNYNSYHIMSIQEQLKNEAISLGLCQEWQNKWGDPDVDTLCDKFIRGLDFCIKHDFPKVEYIIANFSEQDLSRNGIYVEGKHEAKAQKHIVVMGDADVDIYVPEYSICDIYARHDSKVRLHLDDRSWGYITVLDNATVEVVRKGDGAKIKSSFFSGTIVNKEQFDTIHYK